MGGQKFKRSKIEEGENYMIKGSKVCYNYHDPCNKGINPVIGKYQHREFRKKQISRIKRISRKVDAVMKLDARWDDKLTISFKGP